MNSFKRTGLARFVPTLVLVAGWLVLAGCAGMPGTATAEPAPAVPDASQAEEVSASGEVVPGKWANLSFANGGTNLDLLVSEGEQVKKDQALIASDDAGLQSALSQAQAVLAKAELAQTQLNDTPSAAALASAEAALANAEVNYDRLDRAGARTIELDAAQAQVDSAQAALDELKAGPTDQQLAAVKRDLEAARQGLRQAEKALADATLKAPFDGQVIEIIPNEFESAAPSQTVLVLADLSSLHVETTDLSEVDVARIQAGDAARVVFDALPNQTYTGKVERIASRSSGGSAVYYQVTISLDTIPTGLRWGMTAFVVFP